jgi:hypothetical protein
MRAGHWALTFRRQQQRAIALQDLCDGKSEDDRQQNGKMFESRNLPRPDA